MLKVCCCLAASNTLSLSFSPKVFHLVWLLLLKKVEREIFYFVGVPLFSCKTGRVRVLGMWGTPATEFTGSLSLRREEDQKHEAFSAAGILSNKDNPILQSSPNKLYTLNVYNLKVGFTKRFSLLVYPERKWHKM